MEGAVLRGIISCWTRYNLGPQRHITETHKLERHITETHDRDTYQRHINSRAALTPLY